MNPFLKPIGGILIGLGLAGLGYNLAMTQANPYWWSGLLADLSVVLTSLGLLMLVLVPFKGLRQMGAVFLLLGVLCTFGSRQALLSWDSLSLLGGSVVAIATGYLLYAASRPRR